MQECAMCNQSVWPGDWLCLDHRQWLNQEHLREGLLPMDFRRTLVAGDTAMPAQAESHGDNTPCA